METNYRNATSPRYKGNAYLMAMAIGGGLGFVVSKILHQDKTKMAVLIIAGTVVGKLVADHAYSMSGGVLIPKCYNTILSTVIPNCQNCKDSSGVLIPNCTLVEPIAII
jgi:hypothetical protein